jgi:hypothetical protein
LGMGHGHDTRGIGRGLTGGGWAEYLFGQPTFPGDTLTIRAVLSPGGSWDVEMINQSDEVCVVGKVGLGKADWSQELKRPRSMDPTDESSQKGPLTLEDARIGKDWSAMRLDFSEGSPENSRLNSNIPTTLCFSAPMRSLILHGPRDGRRNCYGTILTSQVPCTPEARYSTTAKSPPGPRSSEARTSLTPMSGRPVGTSCRRESYRWWTRIIPPPKGKISAETYGYPE